MTELNYDYDERQASIVEAPKRLSQNLLRFDDTDRAWTFFCATQLVCAMAVLDNVVVTIGIIVVYLLSLYRTRYARLYYAVLVDLPHNLWIRHVKKGEVYWSEDKRASLWKVMPHPVIQRFNFEDDTSLGYIELSNGSGYAVVITASGSEIAACDPEEQAARLQSLSEQFGKIDGNVAMGYLTRPLNKWREKRILSEMISPYVAKAGELHHKKGSEEVRVEQYDPNIDELDMDKIGRFELTLVEDVINREKLFQEVSSNSLLVVVLTVPKRIKKDQDEVDERLYREIFKQADKCVGYLRRSGATDARITTDYELLEFMRLSWDAVGAEEFYDSMESYLTVEDSPEPRHVPNVVRWTKKYVQYDDNYVGALMVTSTGGEYSPDDTNSLYGVVNDEGGQPFYSLFGVGWSGSASREAKYTKFGTIIREDAVTQWKGEDLLALSPEDQERSKEAREKISKLHENRYRQVSFNIILLVYAVDEDSLDRGLEFMEEVLDEAGMEAVRVLGERQLARAAASGVCIDLM